MGMSLSDLPRIGNLEPRDARELARWLRTIIPRDTTVSGQALRDALTASKFAGVRHPELVAAGWLETTPDGQYSADTYDRRLAAGAVDGTRMSFAEAVDLAMQVRARVAAIDGYRGRVRISRVVLYGSAVRSTGNQKPDIGDLDLAVEIDVLSESLYMELSALPEEQQWRAAIEKAGWDKVLMQGDDRITVAGSLSRVLTLFNRQLHGLDLPPTDQKPCLVTLWQHPEAIPVPPAPLGVPALWRPTIEDDELTVCPEELLQTLAYIEHKSINEQERAQALAERLVQEMTN